MCDDDERYVANEAYISGLSLSPHMHRTLYYEQMDKNENECCSKCASCSNIITATYSYTGILPVPLLLLRPLLSRFFFRLHIHSRVSGPLLLLSEMYELIWWWFDGAKKNTHIGKHKLFDGWMCGFFSALWCGNAKVGPILHFCVKKSGALKKNAMKRVEK